MYICMSIALKFKSYCSLYSRGTHQIEIMELSHISYFVFVVFLCNACISSEPIRDKSFFWLNSESSNKIVGGEECGPTEARHQVSLQKTDSHFCGGTVISRSCLLTAAHCVTRVYNPTSIKVKCGSNSLNSGTSYTASKIVLHENYNSNNMQNDIAIMKISGVFPNGSDSNVVAATLPSGDEVYSYGGTSKAITSGYGVMSEGGSTLPANCMCVGVPYVSQDKCNESYDGKIVDSMICAGEEGKDSCQGDSGGPLVEKNADAEGTYVLKGIVSWGRGCARDGYPGVYTKVSKFLDWINSKSSELDCNGG